MTHDVLDDALDRLRGTGTEVAGGGDPNHGPMAAEALVALGRGDLAPGWADRYRRRLGLLPAATSPVTATTWREALGAEERLADWIAFFGRQLAESPWQDVLEEWLCRLARAIVTAGRHGLIRTAHAVRGLSGGSTRLRIEELGVGLAYWASHYRELVGVPHLIGPLDLRTAVDRVPRIMRGQERAGMPRKFVYAVSGKPELLSAVDAAAEPESVTEAIGTLSEAGARQYLANRSRYPLIFVHSVTAPAALRLLLPHMSPETQRVALGYLWQSEAAAVAAYGEDSDEIEGAVEGLTATWTDVVDRSVEEGDPHAIKFVEACRREFTARPSPVYIAAALDWSNRLRAAASWSDEQRRAAGITAA
jgi:hypothetical protein